MSKRRQANHQSGCADEASGRISEAGPGRGRGVSMKATVLGATGHIGSAVVRELVARGHTVTATGRRATPPVNLDGLALNYAAGDLDTPGQIDE